MVVEIELSKNGRKNKGLYKAIVDDIDADLAEFNWKIANRKYARCSVNGKSLAMHRIILERILGRSLVSGEEPDHINNNGLDNRRENLRVATRKQNCINRTSNMHTQGRLRGALPVGKKWHAKLSKEHLGSFDTEEEAHIAWFKETQKLYGNFTVLDERAKKWLEDNQI